MEKACEREVRDLHRFFVEWLTGAVPRTGEVFGRFSEVMGEGFAIISPDGKSTGREVQG